MILIFKGKPLYFIEETEGFSIPKDSIHLSLVIVYSRYALGISDYPYIFSIVFSFFLNRFLHQMILIFKGKSLYFIDYIMLLRDPCARLWGVNVRGVR